MHHDPHSNAALHSEERRRHNSARRRQGEYIANIIGNLIFLWVLYMVPQWDPGFLKDGYLFVLMLLKINVFIQIGGNVVLIALAEVRPARHFIRILMEMAGLAMLCILYYVYPFDFSNYPGLLWLDRILPLIFIIAMVVSTIQIIVYIFKFIRSLTGTLS